MFKVYSILTDTAMQWLSALSDCFVNDALVAALPFINQSFSQTINVRDLADPVEFRRFTEAIDQFSLGNSVPIFLAPYIFNSKYVGKNFILFRQYFVNLFVGIQTLLMTYTTTVRACNK